jgi:hypothetical protein
MDEHNVVLFLQAGGITLRRGQVDRPIVCAQPVRAPLQPIVNGLGDLEEGIVAADGVPIGDEPEGV